MVQAGNDVVYIYKYAITPQVLHHFIKNLKSVAKKIVGTDDISQLQALIENRTTNPDIMVFIQGKNNEWVAFPLHENIVKLATDFFHIEERAKKIEWSYELMYCIATFMYTGCMNLEVAMLAPVYLAAKEAQIQPLLYALRRYPLYPLRMGTISRCQQMAAFAEAVDNKPLRELAQTLLARFEKEPGKGPEAITPVTIVTRLPVGWVRSHGLSLPEGIVIVLTDRPSPENENSQDIILSAKTYVPKTDVPPLCFSMPQDVAPPFRHYPFLQWEDSRQACFYAVCPLANCGTAVRTIANEITTIQRGVTYGKVRGDLRLRWEPRIEKEECTLRLVLPEGSGLKQSIFKAFRLHGSDLCCQVKDDKDVGLDYHLEHENGEGMILRGSVFDIYKGWKFLDAYCRQKTGLEELIWRCAFRICCPTPVTLQKIFMVSEVIPYDALDHSVYLIESFGKMERILKLFASGEHAAIQRPKMAIPDEVQAIREDLQFDQKDLPLLPLKRVRKLQLLDFESPSSLLSDNA